MNAPLSPLEIFRSKGIPHRRIEDWKYSDLRAVLDAETVAHAGNLAWHLRNLPEGVEKVSLADAEMPDWARISHPVDRPMNAAALAFANNGVVLRVPRGAHIAQPLDLEFRASGHAQIVLLLEAGSFVTLLETHAVEGQGLRNVSLSIFLEDGARLTHVRQTPFAGELVSIETMAIRIGKNARYHAHFAGGGSKLSRTDLEVTLADEGAEAELSGVSVLADGAHADLTTHMDHKAGNTKSTQLFKAVAGGKSRGVYQGKITVREGADGSDSRQTAKGLLLGARAEIDLKPELEIFADDVKCAHGAAVGDLDTDSLFYLQSRGIPEAEARALLIRAFLEEAVDGIEREDIRASVWQFVEDGLARAMEAQP